MGLPAWAVLWVLTLGAFGVFGFRAWQLIGLLLKASGEMEPLLSGSLPLGVFADAAWKSRHAEMGPGDRLLLYTDGVIEARDGAELFGEARLAELLRLAATPVEDVPALILEQVLAFSGGSLGDDVAVLALSLAEPS